MRKQKVTTGVFHLLLLVGLALFVAACGSGGQSGTTTKAKAPASQQKFIFTNAGIQDIETFDPAMVTDLPSSTAINLVFTGLVTLDENLNVQPEIASSWDISSDGLTYTFHLKTNVKFSDGTPVTSADVAYSIDRALQPATKSPVAGSYLSLIKDSDQLGAGKIKTIIGDSLKTPDPQTISITLNKKAAYFLDALAYPTSYVVEKSLIEKYGKSWTDHLEEGGGTGPFKVQSYQHNKQIVFVPNPYYYGPKPQLQQIIMPFYQDVKTAYQVYETGQVDITPIPITNIQQARAKTAEYSETPQLSIDYLGMNYLVKPYDNIHFRQALSLAINRDQIMAAIWKNTRLPTYHIVPKGMPGYNASLTGPAGVTSTAGDKTKAKQLLQQALQEMGLSSPSQLPPLQLYYPTGSQDVTNEITTLTSQWQSVLGITVKPVATDFNKLLEDLNAAPGNPKGIGFWSIAWIADYPDPQDWLTLQFDKGSPNNQVNYGQNNSSDAAQQQQVQQNLEQADAMDNGPARYQAYNQAEQQLVNDVAWLSLDQRIGVRLLKPYVIGMKFNAEGLFPPELWADVYIAQH
ncbi:MAG: peptide ABC transporter substrate-binding protein [Thermogemmatispora sp.]|uniref:peptide ABC transporter substrate-binding protein n=1 Tax=Thermogemmatispora sp. TaxID=1968838 RepID=UPI001A0D2E3F|nr:peptide ABC transporter substrate-binding protein [Thermogemmatispora sp.]MBE3566922.1 peptide ABC transporter substrate-binding protein [Thermogemmatispora sp.]